MESNYRSPRSSAKGSDTVILYRASENVPLLPGIRKRTRLSEVGGGCVLLLVLFMAYQTWTHVMYCPPDPATRDATRQRWEGEKAAHAIQQREWTLEKQGWALERARWRQELEQREQREEEERQKHHMFWGNIEKHTCTTYATREYSAQLVNLPMDWKHRLDACEATLLEIHGVSYPPKTCEDKGPGVVIGRWEIDQQEPDCTTYWDSYNDKGCTSPGSGKKYITHKLMNLPDKSDWKEFCATTPISFNHLQFPGAQECITSVWGVYGQWEIDDSSC